MPCLNPAILPTRSSYLYLVLIHWFPYCYSLMTLMTYDYDWTDRERKETTFKFKVWYGPGHSDRIEKSIGKGVGQTYVKRVRVRVWSSTFSKFDYLSGAFWEPKNTKKAAFLYIFILHTIYIFLKWRNRSLYPQNLARSHHFFSSKTLNFVMKWSKIP